MAGNGRFNLTSASSDSGFVGNYTNGPKGSYTGATMDRSGSFRESSDTRIFGSGKGASRGTGAVVGDLPSLSQCLMLEPIVMGDQKYPRSGELRRMLGFTVGSTSEDNSFGAAHLKSSLHVSMEELKRFRDSVAETCNKASGRAKKFDECLHKLTRFSEGMLSKKQQRNEQLNERLGGSNMKMGTQIHRGPSDLVTQKTEERPKNSTLNKRVRTSVAETRAEHRNSALSRQPMIVKDRDMLKDSNADSDMAEEKIRRLPAGGEGWDKKMKRKRSVGAVISRPLDNDGEPKRSLHHRLASEPGLSPSDSHGFRSGISSGAGSINKSDGSSPAGSNARSMLKNEQEKSALCRDPTAGLNKERMLAKGSIKLNSREENHALCPSPLAKGKASRAPRSGSLAAANSPSNVPRLPGTLESWDPPPNVNKNLAVGGANNRKRPLPTGSSSPPITQWIGQRPQKFSRTRRANLISPVSNQDEVEVPSEACSPSDFGARLTPGVTSGSILTKAVSNVTQNLKVKAESVLSPARLSESEESGAGESRLKEKGGGTCEGEEKTVNTVQSNGMSTSHMKKNKFLVKEETGDGVRRQGRSGRGSVFSRSSISPTREKFENQVTAKPLRNSRAASEKHGSKSGRPLKKHSKGFSRLGTPLSSGSPDFTGESDDDREELLAAANLAYSASIHACSSAFWKKMDRLFASVSAEEKSYLLEQLKSAEESHANLSQTLNHTNDVQDDHAHDGTSISDTPSVEKNRCIKNQNGLKLPSDTELVDRFHDSILSAKFDSDRIFDKVTPLYQRVLSALIIEDDIEEYEESGFDIFTSPHNGPETLLHGTRVIDSESRKMNRTEVGYDTVFGSQIKKNGTGNEFVSCNGYGAYHRNPDVRGPPYSDEMSQGDNGYLHSEVGLFVGLSECDPDVPQRLQISSFGISSFERQYAQMAFDDKLLLELESIGLYIEPVPGLDDKEDEAINEEIMQLERGLCQEIGKKKTYMEKVSKAIQEGKDVQGWDPEQIAMNKLVELAYKKLLATRGSLASKNGVPKVSKPVALAFAKRTLSRCRKFEDSRASCFSEPGLHDIIFAAPPRINEADLLAGSCPVNADGVLIDPYERFNHQLGHAFAKNGPILNRGKKKEVLLDDVGAAFRANSTIGGTLLGGAKGKRSERDRDSSARNANAKAGRSLGNSKGERKTKTKPKQKTAQLSTSVNGSFNKYMEITTHPVYPSANGSGELVNTSGNRKREGDVNSSMDKKESADGMNMPLNDIDAIEELGVESELGAPQDFNSWFNFDVDGLQDHDSVGLEIPMDDLSELNMF
ncbi:uncharacterized protein LOC132613929 isoform X1 [Lycium barbarum]|uniref:uncharacterized protein LOC132613929 isoform X1 n=2 Tax=Lycium barbarum TaxID=112863 RepID=UPI00293EDC05|nr:uncharacterized protein LOC132613929 isoform X1 [Lycium barbarum]XP_060184210.1 uncharacterized protein LOC132613929 isoform X1 [Lycium barbarum]